MKPAMPMRAGGMPPAVCTIKKQPWHGQGGAV
jgi:hypothetical protein